MEKGDPLFQP
ncbi:unnamed protein product [Linum tenue]|uniref:Uncharacterized protein n=1 Tax=Linum tenue TaxID=586396 RepID=A0AAV0JT49_9ROSI|nr:unnamed protein product [Linum tenue]CAI0431026.1 unnamed protein product [Linum tenue]CAI0458662.1 unnamed protein product [Linum tenue]CAI0474419.1 unnamed protein product [Linum tenue]